METISIEVEPEIARAYQNSNSTERKKIQMTFNILFKQIMNTRSLEDIIQEMQAQAKANGLTQEILDQILNEDMAQFQNQLTVQQNYIAQLLEQLTVNYHNTNLERKQIAQNHSNSEEEFTPLEEIELLTVSIRGYACQIAASGSLRNDQQAIAELQRLSVFNNHLIVQLYSESRSHYPHMQSYICMLDYLRLLVLEYLQMQQALQPISA
jgi:hypothetical protein